METAAKAEKNENEVCLTDRQMVGVEEYALREGVSVKMVEDLAKLGVVQMRRSRGRAFVADVPLSPYGRGGIAELARTGKSNSAEEEVEKPTANETGGNEGQQTEREDEALERGVIAELVRKMIRKSTKVSEAVIETETEEAEAVIGQRDAVGETDIEDDAAVMQERVVRQGPPRRMEKIETAGRRDMESYLYQSIPMTSSEAVEIINSTVTIADDLAARARQAMQAPDMTSEDEGSETVDTPELRARQADKQEFESGDYPAVDKVTFDIDREFQKLIDEINNFDALPDPTEFLCSAAEAKQQPKQQEKTAEVPLYKRLIRKRGNVTGEQAGKDSSRGDGQQVPQEMGIKLGILTAHARSKTAWKIFGILSLAALFVTVCLLLWVYMDGKMSLTTTQERLDQAYTSVQKLYDDSSQAQQNAKELERQLEKARTRIAEIQNNSVAPGDYLWPGPDNFEQQNQGDMIIKPEK